jgi:hypothetical protein
VHTAIGRIIGDFSWTAHAQNKYVNHRWRYWGDVSPETLEPELVEITKTPVEYAEYPSYAMERTLEILGERVGLSGVMDPGGGAYGINSDIYHLKVNECSAQLYVNEGLGHPYNTAVMRRILNNLGDQLGIAELGTRIMHHRPPGGYKTKAELKPVLGDHYDTLKDFLCVHTWSDPKVVNPVPLNEYNPQARSAYQSELFATPTRGTRGNARATRFCDDGQPSDDVIIYSQKELIPTRIEVTRRAPVNINTAPREILASLLTGLQGFFVIGQQRAGYECLFEFQVSGIKHIFSYPVYSTPGGLGQKDVVGDIGVVFRTKPITLRLAQDLAGLIIQQRQKRPFATWGQFERFIDGLVHHPPETPGLFLDERGPRQLNIVDSLILYRRLFWSHYTYFASQAIADTIKANFNPNLHLNELNPDADLWGWVDKTDLITNSTEFCFLPTGYFEIESVGQILRAEWEPGKFHISPYLLIMKDSFTHNNQIMGQRRLKVVVKLWDLYRQTSQEDFHRGSFSRNNSGSPTSGNWACETGPVLNNGSGPFGTRYEGYVGLATMGGSLPLSETRIKGKTYKAKLKGEKRWFKYNVGMRGIRRRLYVTLEDHLDTDTNRRDGWYADRETVRAYDIGATNFGTLSYWIKPGIFFELDGYTRTISSFNRSHWMGVFDHQIGWTYGKKESDPLNYPWYLPISMRFRFAAMGQSTWTSTDEWPVTQFHAMTPTLNHMHHGCENGPLGAWEIHPWRYKDSPLMAHRWLHVAIIWNYQGGVVDIGTWWNPWDDRWIAKGESAIYVNGRLISRCCKENVCGDRPQGVHTYHDVGGGIMGEERTGEPNPFILGGDRWCNRPAHCTLDEFYFLGTEISREVLDVPCWCEGFRACKGGPGAPCRCSKYTKCKGAKYRPCNCAKHRGCKGGSGKPCQCDGSRRCKGGTISECKTRWKSEWRRRGWRGRWRRVRVPIPCRCGTDGTVEEDCRRWCKCKDGKLPPIKWCSYWCSCKGSGRVTECLSKRKTWWQVERCKCKKGKIRVETLAPSLKARQQWWHGRYYRQNDAEFTSQKIDLAGTLPFMLAEPNPVTDPYRRPRWTSAEGALEEISKDRWGKATSFGVKVLGIAWTYKGWVQDYQGIEYGHDPKPLEYQLELSLYKVGADGERLIAGPFLNIDSGWAPVMYKLRERQKISYRVRFNTRCDPLNSILLESPILDDITIYYTIRLLFLSWQEGY